MTANQWTNDLSMLGENVFCWLIESNKRSRWIYYFCLFLVMCKKYYFTSLDSICADSETARLPEMFKILCRLCNCSSMKREKIKELCYAAPKGEYLLQPNDTSERPVNWVQAKQFEYLQAEKLYWRWASLVCAFLSLINIPVKKIA